MVYSFFCVSRNTSSIFLSELQLLTDITGSKMKMFFWTHKVDVNCGCFCQFLGMLGFSVLNDETLIRLDTGVKSVVDLSFAF